jgi:DNA polymerase III alpha subunit
MRLHDENKQKIADLRREQKDLEISVQAPIVDASVRDRILDNIKQRERSITYLEQAWQSYVTDITGARKDLLKIRDQVPTLEAMRKDAKVQINLIQAVAMLQILKQNIGTLTDTVLRLESIKLHSITPNTLSKLFIVS